MSNKALLALTSYWADFFNKEAQVDLDNKEYFGNIPSIVKRKFQLEYYPEPFYGYFHEDMSEDILVPLINPGEMDEKMVSTLFPSPFIEESIEQSNTHVKERHTSWRKEDYIRREKELIEILGKRNWRNTKFNQCKRLIANDDPGFIHTIEFFPFHSARWNMKKGVQEDWIHSLQSTKLTMDALEEVSKNRLVKHIIGIGKVWATVFDSYKDRFSLESYQELRGPKGGRAHHMFKYKPVNGSNALPIVIYSGASMNLPSTDERAIEVLRRYLELE